MKVGAIIQARMGSTRLPGKVMMKIKGKSVLEHVIDRVSQSEKVDEIIIATTTEDCDNVIVDEALKAGVKSYRGSEDDVLSRYYFAAKENAIDVIIRITSDCPLVDPRIVDEIVNSYVKKDYDIVSNASADLTQRTFPRGLDIEVFSFELLEKAFYDANKQYHREHVTPYIYENSKKIFYYKNDIDYSMHRWTLDTKEDFELITVIYDRLYKGIHNFYFMDIIELLIKEPKIFDINAHIKQKKLK